MGKSSSETNDKRRAALVESPIILGVDPGSSVTGFAFLRANSCDAMLPRDFQVIDAGALKVDPKLAAAQRIGILHQGLYGLISQHRPGLVVMEKAFYDKNIATAIRLGEVRGAYIAAAGRCKTPVFEITPAEVKKIISGNGRATKEQVALSLEALIGFERGQLSYDVTDAVAIALSFGMKAPIAPSFSKKSNNALSPTESVVS